MSKHSKATDSNNNVKSEIKSGSKLNVNPLFGGYEVDNFFDKESSASPSKQVADKKSELTPKVTVTSPEPTTIQPKPHPVGPRPLRNSIGIAQSTTNTPLTVSASTTAETTAANNGQFRDPLVSSSNAQFPASNNKNSAEDKVKEGKPAKPIIQCVLGLEEYKKEAKFKTAPGFIFKDIPRFAPLSSTVLIQDEISSIQALAQRLLQLQRTLHQDLASLELSITKNASSSAPDHGLVRGTDMIGKNWAVLAAEERARLAEPLDQLDYDQRLEVVNILGEMKKRITSYHARLHWSKVAMAIKLSKFTSKKIAQRHKQKDAKEKVSALPDMLNSDLKFSLSAAAAQVKKKSQLVAPVLDLKFCYEQALLSYDQRHGWVKLEDSKKNQAAFEKQEIVKERKETKKVQETKESMDKSHTGVAELPSDLVKLRQSLGKWLKVYDSQALDSASLAAVMQQIEAITDYCLLANRISECQVHLDHEIQLARQILKDFKADVSQDDPELIQAVCQLAAAQDRTLTHVLLNTLMDRLNRDRLLSVPLLQGLATVLYLARPQHIGIGDLNTILKLLVERSKGMGSELSEVDTIQVLKAVSATLVSMAVVSQQRQVEHAQPAVIERGFFARLKQLKATTIEKIEGPTDISTAAIISQEAYEALCKDIDAQLVQTIQSRFDMAKAYMEQPELVFALSLCRQALMRLAHREKPRSQQFIEGAKEFFGILETAKNVVTDFSLQSLFDLGGKVASLIGKTPLGDKLKAMFGDESDFPQPWFEHYLVIKTLIDSDQFAVLEENLIRKESKEHAGLLKKPASLQMDYFLCQGLMQQFDQLIRRENRPKVIQAAVQFLVLFQGDLEKPDNGLWKWPQRDEFKQLQKILKQRCDKEYPSDGNTTFSQRLSQQAQQKMMIQSQVRLNQARHECRKDFDYQWHEFCLQQLRQAYKEEDWQRDSRRYVPALAKPNLESQEEEANLFYPVFHNFLEGGASKSDSKRIGSEAKFYVSATVGSNSSPRVMLLLGDAGTGKSLFIRRDHLIHCERYFGRKIQTTTSHPLSLHLYLNQSPVHYPLETYLKKQGFSDEQIEDLQRQKQLLIHLDGYDEWSGEIANPRVFDAKAFGPWMSNRCQVVVTCRSQHLQGNKHYKEWFMPNIRMPEILQEWVITRLDFGGVERLVRYFVEDERIQGRQPWSPATYLNQFMSSGISDLVRTPIILLMALQVLPVLKKRNKEARISRLDIYQEFMLQYMDRERVKLLNQGKKDLKGLNKAAENYAVALSLALFAKGEAGISYQPASQFEFAQENPNPWDRFFSPSRVDSLLATVVPLRVTPQINQQEATITYQFGFIHKSMLDYFTALGLFRSIAELIAILEAKPPQSMDSRSAGVEMKTKHSASPAVSEGDLSLLLPMLSAATNREIPMESFFLALVTWEQTKENQRWEQQQYQKRQNSPWNARAINNEQSTIEFIGQLLEAEEEQWQLSMQKKSVESKSVFSSRDEIKKSSMNIVSPREKFKQDLVRIIQSSRDYPELTQASANVATLLARLDMGVFSGLDFHKVSLVGADLSGTYWHEVNLKEADLTQVLLAATAISRCDLSDAILKNINLGESASIDVKGDVGCIAVHPKNPDIIAFGEGRGIIVYDKQEAKILYALEKHKNLVMNLCFSPDGHQLVSCDHRGSTCVWNVQAGELIYDFKKIKDRMFIGFSQDGEQLAFKQKDKINIWDIKGKKFLFELEIDEYATIYFAPNAELVSVHKDGTIKLWDFKKGKLTHTFKGHPGKIDCSSLSPNGVLAIAGKVNDYKNTIQIWDIQQRKLIVVLQGLDHQNITRLRYSPREDQLVGVCGKTLYIWNLSAQTPFHIIESEEEIGLFAYSPDGRQLATAGKYIRLWNPQRGTLVNIFRAESADDVHGMAYTCDSNKIVVGFGQDDDGSVGEIRLWDTWQSKRTSMNEDLHEGDVNSLEYLPASGQLVSSNYETIYFRDVQNGKLLRKLKRTSAELKDISSAFNGLTYAPNGQQFAFIFKNKIAVWDFQSMRQLYSLENAHHMTYSPMGEYFFVKKNMCGLYLIGKLPDEKSLIMNYKNTYFFVGPKPISIFYIDNEGKPSQLSIDDQHTDDLQDLLWWSQDKGGEEPIPLRDHLGKMNLEKLWDIIISIKDHRKQNDQVVLMDSRKGTEVWRLPLSKEPTESLCFSPVGHQLAAGSKNELHVWDIKEKASVYSLNEYKNISSLCFSPNGKQLAVNDLGLIHILNSKGELLYKLQTSQTTSQPDLHEKGFFKYSPYMQKYSPNVQNLQLASTMDNKIFLWDLQTGQLIHFLEGHSARVYILSYSPSGHYLLSSSGPRLRLWDTRTGRCLQILHCFNDISKIQWQGDLLFVGCYQGIVLTFQWNKDEKFTLKWVANKMSQLSFDGSFFMGAKGLTKEQHALIDQRGGQLTEERVEGLKERESPFKEYDAGEDEHEENDEEQDEEQDEEHESEEDETSSSSSQQHSIFKEFKESQPTKAASSAAKTADFSEEKAVSLPESFDVFQEKLIALLSQRSASFVLKRLKADLLSIQFISGGHSSNSQEVNKNLSALTELFKEALTKETLNIKPTQIILNEVKLTLTINAESGILNKAVEILQKATGAYFPAISRTMATLFYHSPDKEVFSSSVRAILDDKEVAVTCAIQ